VKEVEQAQVLHKVANFSTRLLQIRYLLHELVLLWKTSSGRRNRASDTLMKAVAVLDSCSAALTC
jgi:hypothetical protein